MFLFFFRCSEWLSLKAETFEDFIQVKHVVFYCLCVVSNPVMWRAYGSSGGLVKRSLWRGLRPCISNRLPAEVDAAGLQTTL